MTSIFPVDSEATFNNTAPTPSPPIFDGGGNDQSMQDRQPGSSNNSGIFSASADFILYVIITLFFVLTCTLADRRRRRRLDGLDAASEQLRAMRRQQQLHREQQNVNNTRTVSRSTDPEKQKEEILNALILRTVTISDITVPSIEEEEKNDRNKEQKNTINTSTSRLSSFLTRSNKRGVGASATSSSKSLSRSTHSGKTERKRSVLLIRRKNLSGSNLPGRSFNSQHNINSDETLSDINVSVRSAQSDIVIGASGLINNSSSRDLEEGISNNQRNSPLEDATGTCNGHGIDEESRKLFRNSCRMVGMGITTPTNTTSTRSVLPLVNEEEQEHGDNNSVAGNSAAVVVDEQDIVSPLASSSPPSQQTELMGMLLLEEDEDEESSSDHHHYHKDVVIVSSSRSSHGRLADATCSICLLGYEEGDNIAWSRNPKCNHAFHETCIVPWLMTKHDECPNCRNNYFVFEADSSKHSSTVENAPTLISDDDDDDEYSPSERVIVVPGLIPEERV